MNLIPHKFLASDTAAPLHQLLLNFGKGRRKPEPAPLPMHLEAMSAVELLQYEDVAALERRARELTVKQLATVLRMQAEETDDVSILDSLESLVLAGEIAPKEFIDRVENLFPHAMTALDISMRMKVAALVL